MNVSIVQRWRWRWYGIPMSHVTRGCLVSHEWMSHVTHMNEACRSWERIMSKNINESCHTYEWVMSNITCVNEYWMLSRICGIPHDYTSSSFMWCSICVTYSGIPHYYSSNHTHEILHEWIINVSITWYVYIHVTHNVCEWILNVKSHMWHTAVLHVKSHIWTSHVKHKVCEWIRNVKSHMWNTALVHVKSQIWNTKKRKWMRQVTHMEFHMKE